MSKKGFNTISTNLDINEKKDNSINTLFKREVYDNNPLDTRKSELCQYLGIIKKSYLQMMY